MVRLPLRRGGTRIEDVDLTGSFGIRGAAADAEVVRINAGAAPRASLRPATGVATGSVAAMVLEAGAANWKQVCIAVRSWAAALGTAVSLSDEVRMRFFGSQV